MPDDLVITATERKVMLMIWDGQGTFHRFTGISLERKGLATPHPTLFNMITKCNEKHACDWFLTEIGRVQVLKWMARQKANS